MNKLKKDQNVYKGNDYIIIGNSCPDIHNYFLFFSCRFINGCLIIIVMMKHASIKVHSGLLLSHPKDLQVKTLLIDDELSSLKNLKCIIENNSKAFEVAGAVASTDKARKIMDSQRVDLLFLDVEMPGENGFTFLETLGDHDYLVVFVTAFDKYAIRAFEANAIDYLIKPVQPEDLLKIEKRLVKKQIAFKSCNKQELYRQSISKTKYTINQKGFPKQIIINNINGFSIVYIDDLIYLESANYCTIFHLKDGNVIVSSKRMNSYISVLDPTYFFRIHRSYIINLCCLQGTCSEDGSYYAILKDNTRVEVSRRRKNDFISTVKTRLSS